MHISQTQVASLTSLDLVWWLEPRLFVVFAVFLYIFAFLATFILAMHYSLLIPELFAGYVCEVHALPLIELVRVLVHVKAVPHK